MEIFKIYSFIYFQRKTLEPENLAGRHDDGECRYIFDLSMAIIFWIKLYLQSEKELLLYSGEIKKLVLAYFIYSAYFLLFMFQSTFNI